jgi:hypothetical protein
MEKPRIKDSDKQILQTLVHWLEEGLNTELLQKEVGHETGNAFRILDKGSLKCLSSF